MPSSEYWRERAIQREQEAFLRGEELLRKMQSEYEQAARAMRLEIHDFYMRYARENGLTFDEAVRLMSQPEYIEWRYDLGQYVSAIAAELDDTKRAALTAQLDALSYNSSISRLDGLCNKIDIILDGMYVNNNNLMMADIQSVFVDGYYTKWFDVQQRRGIFAIISPLDPELVKSTVNYPWSGAMFSDRLWQNKQSLLFNVREIVTQGVIQGQSAPEMSKRLSEKMGQSFKAAERLVRTETTHIHAAATREVYLAAGIKKYEFMATLDKSTCGECADLDGKVFDVAEALPGENYPPIHPNDRCTTIEHDPDERLDWEKKGEPMPKRITVLQWREKQGLAA